MIVEEEIHNYDTIKTKNDKISFDYNIIHDDLKLRLFETNVKKDTFYVNCINNDVFYANFGYGLYEITMTFDIIDDAYNIVFHFNCYFNIFYYTDICNISIYEQIDGFEIYGIKLYCDMDLNLCSVDVSATSDIKCSRITNNIIFLYKNYETDVLNDIIELNISIKLFNEIELKIEFINQNLIFKKVSNNRCFIRISPLKMQIIDGIVTYLISTLEQLKFVLTYNYYGYIPYDDGINYDVEIYGNINDYNFKLTNDIDFNGAYIYINVGILFGGILDGDNHTISNLNFVVVKGGFISNSRYRGIFESNYGIIKNIKFNNVEFDITELQKNIDTTKYKNGDGKIVGFITPANYGTIENIKYNNCKYKYMYYDKQLIGGKWKVRYKEINESNQLEF